MKASAAIANASWLAASLPEWLRFRRSASKVEETQRRLLDSYIRNNAATEFGQAHKFASIKRWEDYRASVPVRTYDDFQPWIDRIAHGSGNILTVERVDLLEPSSGSSGPEKWVPYTKSLQAEFRRAVAAWTAQNFVDTPGLLGGRAYWSLTPQPAREQPAQTSVPVGFDADSAYLGGLAQRLIDLTLVTLPELKRITDMERFWHVTLLLLLKCPDLRLISVWHPSYVLLLLQHMKKHWRQLLDDLASGLLLSSPTLRIEADPARAGNLEAVGPQNPTAIWPRLRLISCWGDANATGCLNEVSTAFPGVSIQPKGLLATEAFATFPMGSYRPLAIRSHFFEFLDEHGDAQPSWSLQSGQVYSIVVTTGGGLYRYRLQDRVQVSGFFKDIPSLVFIGKEDNVSDHFGEKLDETFVAACLKAAFECHDLEPQFAMLAMDLSTESPGYTLYLQSDGGIAPEKLTETLDLELCRNPHYELCTRLGQLTRVRVMQIEERAYDIYTQSLWERGMRLGDIKPTPLSRFTDWSACFLEVLPAGRRDL